MSDAPVKSLDLPLTDDVIRGLEAGVALRLTGELIGMRDAAHRRIVDAHAAGEALPVDFTGATLYYTGPAPAKEGWVVGPSGPTTSSRMDAFTPTMLELGVRGMIGKGKRDPEVVEAMVRHGAVYFHAVGGAAALIASFVEKVEVLTYEDLGTEAIHRFTVRDMPVVVAIDATGRNAYEEGRMRYRRL